jgi:carbon storage regulator
VLILSRREAESVCLGDDVVLTIVAVGNDKVRIGVKAPPGVRILRTELEIEVTMLPFKLRETEPAVQPLPPLLLPAPANLHHSNAPESRTLEPAAVRKVDSAPLTAMVRRAAANRRAA